MSDDAPVRYERIGVAAVLTIDRPERRNAVDGPTAEALADGLAAFEADPQARVLVLTGEGGTAFCAGADLKDLASFQGREYGPGGPLGFTRLTASKPTIAAIDGWCVAGGLELALWCDLRICTEGSRFAFLERRWGVPLIDGGTQRLPRIIGLGRALDLILTGREVDAAEAGRIGLVTRVVAAGQHRAEALALAETLAGFPQEAMLADRLSAIEGIGRTFEDGMWLEARRGVPTVASAAPGAARFAAGAGRAGSAT
jgi:enoyl-CoA hydratase/carnithine racemase